MAKGIALAVVLVAIAATYWRPLRRVRKVLAVDYLLSTGHAFLVLGYVLGLVFGDRPAPLARDLSPIVAFVAGWVGFATGMRFEGRILRAVPARAFVAGLLPAIGAATVVGVAAGAILLLAGSAETHAYAAALVLGAAAASSGPTLVAVLRGRRAGRSALARPVLRMIEFSAGVDDIVVVLLASLAFALFRIAPEPIAPLWLLALALGSGVLLGCVTWLFLGGRAKEDERLLLGLAMLAFIAGFAVWLDMSPAGVAAIAAVVLVNLPGERMGQLLVAVGKVERPAVVILMSVIGFHISGSVTWIFWPLLGIMTLARAIANHGSGKLAAGVAPAMPGMRTCRNWTHGLAPQGILGLVVTLSFFHVWQDDLSRTALAAVAVASLVNELAAPWLLLRLLRGIAPASLASTVSAPEGRP
jgi:hypothetical protein